MTIEYKEFTEEYVDSAVDAIELAFEGDPLDDWLYDNASKKIFRRKIREFGIRRGFKIGKKMLIAVEKETNLVVGVLITEPPVDKSVPTTESWRQWYDSWTAWAERKKLDLTYGPVPITFDRFKEEQEINKQKLMPDKNGFWYLHILGVRPGYQGQGISSGLMREVLKEADRGGYRSFLESTKRVPNMAIYERLGFKYVSTMGVEVDGKIGEVYCMIREPQPIEQY